MNPIAEEIESYQGCGSMTTTEFLEHYGMPRRSGRYPWGSGEDPYQHERDFLSRVEEMMVLEQQRLDVRWVSMNRQSDRYLIHILNSVWSRRETLQNI